MSYRPSVLTVHPGTLGEDDICNELIDKKWYPLAICATGCAEWATSQIDLCSGALLGSQSDG
jgi:hypothetical protein